MVATQVWHLHIGCGVCVSLSVMFVCVHKYTQIQLVESNFAFCVHVIFRLTTLLSTTNKGAFLWERIIPFLPEINSFLYVFIHVWDPIEFPFTHISIFIDIPIVLVFFV